MRNRRPLRLSIIPILAAVLCSAGMFATSAAPDDPAASENTDAFHKLTRDFIEADLQTYPEMATDVGDHRFDARMTDLSRAAIETRIAATKKWKHDFQAISSDHLAATDEADDDQNRVSEDKTAPALDGCSGVARGDGSCCCSRHYW